MYACRFRVSLRELATMMVVYPKSPRSFTETNMVPAFDDWDHGDAIGVQVQARALQGTLTLPQVSETPALPGLRWVTVMVPSPLPTILTRFVSLAMILLSALVPKCSPAKRTWRTLLRL